VSGFVCIYYGNTGSSWLMAALGASGSIYQPAFEPLEQWAWPVSTHRRLEWLETLLSPPGERSGDAYEAWLAELRACPHVTHGPHSPAFVHPCLKLSDLVVEDTVGVIDVVDRTGAKVIHLVRDNRLKHGLSLYRYHEEEKSQFAGDVRQPTRVEFGRFRHWLRESARLHAQAMDVRASFVDRLGSDRVLPVAYEEFVDADGKARVLQRVCEFLEVPPIAPTDAFAKATPDTLRDAIANYSAFVRRHRWGRSRAYLD
jgi:hypothetical protein